MKRTTFTIPRLLALLACLASSAASAKEPLGIYVGAGAGEAHVRTDEVPGGFDEHHSGWTVFAGIRPVSVIGAEVQYIDFGHPTARIPLGFADAQARGTALLGVGYLPLPVPLLDVYAKAGIGRLNTVVNDTLLLGVACTITHPNCNHFHEDRTDTRFAWGAGAQLKWSSFAVRTEYVRYHAPNGDPDLASLELLLRF